MKRDNLKKVECLYSHEGFIKGEYIRKTNGIHYYICNATNSDYNVYYKGRLVARERNGVVSWVKRIINN